MFTSPTILLLLTFLLGSLAVPLTVFLFLILSLSSEASVCSTMTFSPLGNADYAVVSVSIGFPVNAKQDALFHYVAYDYSRADWDGLCDHLRDIQRNHLCQQNISSESKVQFKQASSHYKRALEAAKLAYATKRNFHFPETWVSELLANCQSFLNKGKSAIPPLFNIPEVLPFASDKSKLLAKKFSKNSNLYDLGISLPLFPSRTNLKLHNISKVVKKVITNLDSSNAPGSGFIPVVVLKNCEPKRSYILAEIFNMCLKESCFPDCWKVLLVVPVFQGTLMQMLNFTGIFVLI